MPCTDWGYPGEQGYEYRELKDRCDRATRVACELAKYVGRYAHGFSEDTKRWIREHEEMDRRREQSESIEASRKAIKKRALSKLTPKEREILGLTLL